ncbi:unnamed protein product [Cyclocybe aegerita]|uniref:Uncharacterized protein n=1 Tax=Cyclocybe aegerita TaxID=1973307 RepID=A0A8S0VXE3_CYCAE|nr:unnamed protein product [Cyclocybe aegerita]
MVGLRAVAVELGLGSADADTSERNGESASGNMLEADRELPSYRAHVRDRVANMFLPEAVTVRVSNPWIGRVGTSSPGDGSSPAAVAEASAGYLSRTASGTNVTNLAQSLHEAALQSSSSAPLSRGPRSGRNTPGSSSLGSAAHQHLPHAPVAGESTPLDWVNSELLLSLSDEPIRRLWGDQVAPPTDPLAPPTTTSMGNAEITSTATENTGRGGSRWGSRWGSRAPSRNPSPERRLDVPPRPSPSSTRLSLDSNFERPSPLAPPDTPGGSSVMGRHRHSHSHSSSMRNLQSLLKATMKPFTTLAAHGNASSSTSPEHSRSTTPPPMPHSHSAPVVPTLHHTNSRPTATSSACPLTTPSTSDQSPHPSELSGPALLHRALTEVPDYSIASRGFIGGVPPLTSMRGLPSYEEAARSRTSTDDSDVPQVRPPAGPESSPSTPSEWQRPTEEERRRSSSCERRGTASEPDLVGLVGRGRHGTVVGIAARDGQGQHPGILQTLATEPAEASDEDGSDEGIEIHVRRRH